jgi:hypothetical protein
VYTQQLPADASQADLLHMAGVADAFELSSVSAACMEQLAQLPVAELEWGTVTGAFALPDGVAGLAASSGLLAAASERLRQLLGNLDLVLCDPQLRQQLEALPHAALLALLQDEQTRVAAESSAVAAVALWVAAQVAAGGTVGLQQRQQLAAAIRMVQLPAMYLASVLPRMGWLCGIITAQHISQFLAAKGVPDAHRQRFPRLCLLGGPEPAAAAATQQEAWPDAWLAAARPQASCEHMSKAIHVPVPEINARGSAGQAGRWASGAVVVGGYELGARVELSQRGDVRVAMAVQAIGVVPDVAAGAQLAEGRQLPPVAVVMEARLGSGVETRPTYTRCDGLYTDGSAVEGFFNRRVNACADWQAQATALAPHTRCGELTIWLTVFKVV